MPQEVVHRRAEVKVRAHDCENQKIPSKGDAIDKKEEEEEDARMFRCVHQTLQEEVAHHSLVEVVGLYDHHIQRVVSYHLCNKTDIDKYNKEPFTFPEMSLAIRSYHFGLAHK